MEVNRELQPLLCICWQFLKNVLRSNMLLLNHKDVLKHVFAVRWRKMIRNELSDRCTKVHLINPKLTLTFLTSREYLAFSCTWCLSMDVLNFITVVLIYFQSLNLQFFWCFYPAIVHYTLFNFPPVLSHHLGISTWCAGIMEWFLYCDDRDITKS